MSYANGTTVEVSKSRADIEKTLQKYGATSYQSGWESNRAAIQFKAHNRVVRFALILPDRQQWLHDWQGRGDAGRAHDAELRRLWRCLLLVIKAKLESVENHIETFEDAFLGQIVIPGRGGETVAMFLKPMLAEAYEKGSSDNMPLMLGNGR